MMQDVKIKALYFSLLPIAIFAEIWYNIKKDYLEDMMQDFFNSITWYLISSICTLMGLIGAIITIRQYVKGKRENKEYQYLFKIAGQHLDLADKESTINDYDKKINDMKNIINKQIPEEAKKIALQSIYDYEVRTLSNSYTRVKILQEQLNTGIDVENNELLKNIHKDIEPKYSQNRHNALLNSIFVTISVISSFLSMILPYGVYKLILIVTLLFQLVIGFKLLRNHINSNYSRKEILRVTHAFILMFSIIFLLIASFVGILFLGLMNEGYVNEIGFLVTILIFYLLHIISGMGYFVRMSSQLRKKAFRMFLLSILGYSTCCFLIPICQNAFAVLCLIAIMFILAINEFVFLIRTYIRRTK